MYFASLRYTSPTFLASMVNTIASLTFAIAILLRSSNLSVNLQPLFHCVCIYTNWLHCLYLGLVTSLCRLEVLDLRKPRGVAKAVGTLVSLAGVMTMTLYKGPIVRNLGHPPIHLHGKTTIQENWLKGSILTVASCITWSIWYIMQVNDSSSHLFQVHLYRLNKVL